MIIEKWIEGIAYYCRVLYKVNQKIIKLADLDCINEGQEAEDYFYEIAENIVTLIPCSANDSKVCLCERDGIFDFVNELNFLKKDIENIFEKNKEAFHKIKLIRNKHEHVAHKINVVASSSGTSSLISVTFDYEDNTYRLNCEEFINIMRDVNIMFNKIIECFREFKEEYDKNNPNSHPYLEKYSNINFLIFNNLYNSDVLRECSRAMHNL